MPYDGNIQTNEGFQRQNLYILTWKVILEEGLKQQTFDLAWKYTKKRGISETATNTVLQTFQDIKN
jgi:hypothetical protein